MGEEIKIDKALFSDRLSTLYTAWKADKRSTSPVFGGATSIVVVMGRTEDTNSFQKSNSVHFWLLGYEFPATLCVFTLEGMYVVTTGKKAKHLEPLQGGKIPVELLIISKDPETKTKAFEKCLDLIKSSGNKVGVLPKDTSSGPFADEWKRTYSDISKNIEEVDIGPALSSVCFSVKSQEELILMRNAARACSGLMSEYFVDEMSQLLDEEKKMSHRALSAKIDAKLDDAKFFNKLKLPAQFDAQHIDWAYGPIVQSGGNYDLKFSAISDSNNLQAGIIIATFGIRYQTYAAAIGRTFLVDPTKSQENNYGFLLSVYDAVIKEIRDGAVVKDLYNKALGLIRAKKPDLEKHFVKNIGASIGIELRDNNMVLNGKNTKTLRSGMTLCLAVGFTDVADPDAKEKKDRTYSMVITDTVRVGDSGPHVFTKDAGMDLDSVSFYFGDEEEEQAKPKKSKQESQRSSAIASKNITKTKLRAERPTQSNEGAEARRREHQKELAAKKTKEGLERFAGTTGDENGVAQKNFKRFESYKRDSQLPTRVKDLAVYVDLKASSIIVPIMGRPVPFHINTIKNASKNDEGEYAYLRINFLSPGQGVGRKDDQPFEDPSAHFLRNLTLRSKDKDRLGQVAQDITELRKNALRREQVKKEMEDVVEQDKLIEIRNRRPVKLPDVYLRPPLDGKRVPGEVEIHQNGLRYLSPLRNDHVDVLFSNVKHLFFQPCAHEMIVIIHVHLKTPIMIGKRKTRDVQFYREATEMQFDETGNRRRKHRYGDEEEFEAEQEERRRRAALDREFKAFAEKISDAGKDEGVDVDIPFREIGFTGVPNRSNVLVQPTTDAVVQLTEPPFLVVTLNEIEVAHLERVQFGLKNFDLVFVFKDFHRPPAHINTIPVENLEGVKDWLDSVDIAFTEGPLNLSWNAIMKTVTSDPHGFFRDGGWSFLATESDSEESEEDEESAFEMDDSDVNESEESSEEESEFDDDASASASEGISGDDDEDGEDWDELERKAKKKDAENKMEDRDSGKKRKR
ncbi:FACT complex subunit spt16 [Ophidiomyces ophidiicola]|uniref:FACT complex subunit spt16 n=1 Tax=Ophidiomyces ophidiicola TaxID=1387563 RepID=UPI0020C49E99|nr:FACT complex subunit spt16 [Ophidiomyces ophidiicola]KAI1947601.1 FACT complex subunit spt16 [Ophidiomyces ophidiicola]KAI1954094.1 FACT complex subunit spt16 [Ophidiomyces ophidiicola]KAI1957626.1 FACT complex subunit spt16 [Ophidiomyces ophidiicola]KAI1971307.1 FACT complex subunit spt16 [Ophidiomyces ophidiicola]KAI2006276.1 FACT complex subunit spt16 [Ophidiomyces ophidiicola]